MAVANSARKKAGGGGKFKSGSTSESACGESRNLVCFPMSRREGRKPGPTRRKKQHTASRRSPESLEHSSLNGTKQGCAPLERVSFRVFKQGFPRSPGEDTDRGALPFDTQTTSTPVSSGRPRRPVPGSRILGVWESRRGISGAAAPPPGSRGPESRENPAARLCRAPRTRTRESENPRSRDSGTGRASARCLLAPRKTDVSGGT